MTKVLFGTLLFLLGGYAAQHAGGAATAKKPDDRAMRLGNFSVSLTVKDIAKSREFYERLGFRVWGEASKRMVILQNDTATIGLFEGAFPKNTLTFNPGWDRAGKPLASFEDVREIQKTLVSRGLELATKADESSTGPASLIVVDPDGNPILIDQHVPAPKK